MANCLGSICGFIGSCLSGTDNSQSQPSESRAGPRPISVHSSLSGDSAEYEPVPRETGNYSIFSRTVSAIPNFAKDESGLTNTFPENVKTLELKNVDYHPVLSEAKQVQPIIQPQSEVMIKLIDRLKEDSEYNVIAHNELAKKLANELESLKNNIESKKMGGGKKIVEFSSELEMCLSHKCGASKETLPAVSG